MENPRKEEKVDNYEKINSIVFYLLTNFKENEIALNRIDWFLKLLNYSSETEKILVDALMEAEGEKQKEELPF